jgi:DNA-binding response OmpR family regulator
VVFTNADDEVLPALGLLSHHVKVLPAQNSQIATAPNCDLFIIDGRTDLATARRLCTVMRSSGLHTPILLVLTEGGLTALSPDWGITDIILASAAPAETDVRIKLGLAKLVEDASDSVIRASGVVIDEASYSAKVRGRPLDLTFKEFELLKFLASHPSRVFTREQLLSEVWGYDYFGGTRTVDVHVRRLRAKLGDLDSLIGTVRNVGYRFNDTEDGHEPAGAGNASASA